MCSAGKTADSPASNRLPPPWLRTRTLGNAGDARPGEALPREPFGFRCAIRRPGKGTGTAFAERYLAQHYSDGLRLRCNYCSMAHMKKRYRRMAAATERSSYWYTNTLWCRVTRFTLLALFTVFGASVGSAQTLSPPVGERVRVRVDDLHRQGDMLPRSMELRGTLTALDSSALFIEIAPGGGSITVPRPSIRSFAISKGVPSRLESAVRRGAAWTLMGALLGFGFRDFPDRGSRTPWQDAVIVGAGTGAITGVFMGALSPYERWRRVPVP